MPRYVYRCTACEELSTIQHTANVVHTSCPECGSADGLVKVLTAFSTKRSLSQKKGVGQITEEFIQDSRVELDKSKRGWKVED